ncbi:hypothetical protein QLH51_06370 [Sphingomonas sp. 2R-10]|uniref:hypothetical protein n=1 Tax=Sphingomonas sp. 2R-10 TaxID=3045148 RepID=UPI000F779559|nr:hypothetical protein [Sphingomonas sp. 2R-10]MDJ0276421.1 hypothetical protein [Sphingomonas sp. 2R-10]
MTFASFSWPVVLAGALAIAALLYVLQRLRQHRRPLALPTAALWRQATEASRMPVLGARFRYWLAFLLALAIGLLLWLAVAHPMATPAGGGGRTLFYFDASAAMVADGEEARARRALLADVRALDAADRAVYLGDAQGTRLLDSGESASLLSSRLDRVTAGARPSAFAAWLAARVRDLPANAPLVVRYYGSPAAARAAAAGLPSNVRLDYGYLTAPVAGNRGIVALGASPAADGRWDRADVIVGTAGAGVAPPAIDALSFLLGDRDYRPARVETLGAGAFVVRDVPADGRVLTVSLLDGDAFSADDDAMLRLPDRRPIRVALTPGVPATVRAAVASDTALTVVPAADAQVLVRTSADADPRGLPALVAVPAAAQADAFLFRTPDPLAGPALSAQLDDFGLAGIDARAIADRLRRPVSVRMETGRLPTVSVWAELLDPASPFARSATLPLFVSRSLRWLAAPDPWVPYARAGAPVPDQSALYGLGDRRDAAARQLFGDRPLGDAGTAGAGDRPMAVSLTDRATTLGAAQPAGALAVTPLGGTLPDPVFTLLVLAALLLLALEWVLFQRGWMP